MNTSFDSLIDSFLENKVGITENFLSVALSAHLKANLYALFADEKLLAAGIGNHSILNKDKFIRSDKIYWLGREHNDTYENTFFDLMDLFVKFLNETCYTGITGYEFHYALYEAGSFYKKHLDQFQNNKSRAFSMILYLNDDWQAQDGGELCIYHTDEPTQTISPTTGKCIFFKSSELVHEVLVTKVPRLSITGWLKV